MHMLVLLIERALGTGGSHAVSIVYQLNIDATLVLS
jgi:hypothetical protein